MQGLALVLGGYRTAVTEARLEAKKNHQSREALSWLFAIQAG